MGLTGNEIEDSLLQVVRLILYVLKLSFCRNLPGFCSPSHIAEDICLKNLVGILCNVGLLVPMGCRAPHPSIVLPTQNRLMGEIMVEYTPKKVFR